MEAMVKYGGGFIRSLGRTAMLADSENLKKIKSVFGEQWWGYSVLAKADKKNSKHVKK